MYSIVRTLKVLNLNNFYKYKRKLLRFFCSDFQQIKDNNLNILFFGTDNFSLPSLKLLNEEKKKSNHINQLSVITSFKSQMNPIRKYAENNNMQCLGWPITETNCKNYDIGIVVSFGHLLPENIISSFPYGMINVHASLLPRWRGAAPIIYAIKNGDKITGITIMKIRPKHFDIGEILAQSAVPIPPNILMPELHNTLANKGSQLLLQCIRNLPNILSDAKPQSKDDITYAPKVQQSLTEIKWNEMTALQIYNLYRALYSYKNVTTKWNNLLVKLIEISICDEKAGDEQLSQPQAVEQKVQLPGHIIYIKTRNYLKILCRDGNSIRIHKLAIEGKKIISASDFNNGFLKKSLYENHYFV